MLRVVLTEDLEQVHAIRVEVFVQEQGFSVEDEFDEKDDASDHFLLFDDNDSSRDSSKAVGTVRYYPALAKLGRLAVLKSHRGIGAGRVLVDALHAHVIARRAKAGTYSREKKLEKETIVAVAQLYAIPFYAKCGYFEFGGDIDDGGQPHRRMQCLVQLSPL